MRIGINTHLFGRPDGPSPAPTWASIEERARVAEAVGFDSFIFEDSLSYHWEDVGLDDAGVDGVWESVSIAAALAAVTERIEIGQSVFNSPLRSPALTAAIAETIDEISGGRFVFGIGAGNSPQRDYDALGFAADHRYSRFAEAIHIIHSLLKTGRVDFQGRFYSAEDGKLILRGPRPEGPPINIAARGPKMIRLVAEYADAWNWWSWGKSIDELQAMAAPLLELLEESCAEVGRDPDSIVRTFDIFTVVPEGFSTKGMTVYHHEMPRPIAGSSEEIAEYILALGDLGFAEVRCDVYPNSVEAVAALEPVVEMVHAG